MIDFNTYFEYSEDSPTCLKWRLTGKGIPLSKIAGNFAYKASGEKMAARVMLNGETFVVSRIIYELFNNKIENGLVIDHLDGNPFNNKKENLQLVTQTVNNRNRKISSLNKTGYTGVTVLKGNVLVQVTNKDLKLKRSKLFNIEKLGYDVAIKGAVKWREDLLHSLKDCGVIYSDRHGK